MNGQSRMVRFIVTGTRNPRSVWNAPSGQRTARANSPAQVAVAYSASQNRNDIHRLPPAQPSGIRERLEHVPPP